MTTYLISYELAEPNLNKREIANAIMVTGEAWARPLDQTWYIRSDCEASEIEALIEQFLGDHDGLLVQPVADGAHLTNAALRWFKRRRESVQEPAANVVPFPAQAAA